MDLLCIVNNDIQAHFQSKSLEDSSLQQTRHKENAQSNGQKATTAQQECSHSGRKLKVAAARPEKTMSVRQYSDVHITHMSTQET